MTEVFIPVGLLNQVHQVTYGSILYYEFYHKRNPTEFTFNHRYAKGLLRDATGKTTEVRRFAFYKRKRPLKIQFQDVRFCFGEHWHDLNISSKVVYVPMARVVKLGTKRETNLFDICLN